MDIVTYALLKNSSAGAEQYAEEAKAYAEEAKTSATEAASSATVAEETASTVEEYVVTAESAATNASAFADEAKTSAGSAATSADEAAASATEAANSASSASTSADNASTSAAAAEASASSASESATVAGDAATKASENATAASESATAASESATTASESATAASESATSAADSATSAEDDASSAEDSAQRAGDAATVAILAMLDGTEETYKKAMKLWFYIKGAQNYADDEDYLSLTSLVDEWYTVSRADPWSGYTEFYQPDVSSVSYGTKGGDNEGLSCTPSTDTVANQDDYAGLPLFACIDCNWVMDYRVVGETYTQPIITAIDGITDNFERDNPEKYVGVLQMAGYILKDEDDETYKLGYASYEDTTHEVVEPIAESINANGTVRSWVVHSKYMSHTTDGKMTSCSGLIPTAWMSHNVTHTLSAVNGDGYGGGSIADDAWLYLMTVVKYGSLTLDGILQGCVNCNYQYPAQVAETGVRRILVATNNTNMEVGMNVLVGNYMTATDRNNSYMYEISGQKGVTITAIETVTIESDDESTNYLAIYVDTDDVFDTGANGTATEGTTYISSFHWTTGSCDSVLGNDGSPTSCTSGKYPAKLQGIEYSIGAYEVYSDVILSLYQDAETKTYYYEPYVVKIRANQSTSITSNYEATGLVCEQLASAAWRYIKKRDYSNGVFFATNVDGSSSTYLRDAFYTNASASGTREWLAFGLLHDGSGHGGLSYLYGNNALSHANWAIAARLSPNCNRGELAA